MNRRVIVQAVRGIIWLLAAVGVPSLASGLTEAEVAAASRAYFAPISSIAFWRMRMPDGFFREFELLGSASGEYHLSSADGWTGILKPEKNDVLISPPKGTKPKVEWWFRSGTLMAVIEGGKAYGLDYTEPVVYAGGRPARLWPAPKEVKRKDVFLKTKWEKGRRLRLWFISPNRAGAFLSFLTLIALGVALRLKRRSLRLLAGALGVVMLVPMTMTGSRGALLAFFLGAGVIIVCELRRLRPSRRTVFLLVGSALLAVAVMGVFLNSGIVRTKRSNRGSDRQRSLVMETAPKMLRDAPKGWGRFGQVGAAYVDWYQSKDDAKLRYNLISDHVTNVVGRGWVGGGIYLFCWFGGLLTLILFAWRGGSPIPAALWLALGTAAMFNLILGELNIYALPVLSLLLFLRGRPWRMPGIFAWGALGGAALAAVTIAGLVIYAGDEPGYGPRVRNDGCGRILIGGTRPVRWVVDDLQVLGHVMTGRDMRDWYVKHPGAPSVGYLRSVGRIPTDGQVRRLTIAGEAGSDYLKHLEKNGYPEKMPESIIFLSPPFPPSRIPEELRRRSAVTVVIGEFAARYSREYLAQRPDVRIVSNVELYIPDWMDYVIGPPG